MTAPSTITATLAMLRGESPEMPLDWAEIVAFASAQLVLPALDPALVGNADAAKFLADVRAGNVARNAEMRLALIAVGRALNARGIEPILLKGANILATSQPTATAWRFLSDLDLLVPPQDLETAIAVARDNGFRASGTDYDSSRDAHYPALIAPCGRFALELHTRVFADCALPLLETRLPTEASAATVAGAVLRIPSLADRIAHLIAHAQLHHGHFRAHRLLLRGLLELSQLTEGSISPELWLRVIEVFSGSYQQRAALAYLAAWRSLMASDTTVRASNRGDCVWARRAIAELGQAPRKRAVKAVLGAIAAEALRTLNSPAILRRHLITLASPSAIAKRLARYRHRLRQSYWA